MPAAGADLRRDDGSLLLEDRIHLAVTIEDDPAMGLSEPMAAAVNQAIPLINSLVERLMAERRASSRSTTNCFP